MSALFYKETKEKRGILRELYGGMMSLADLSRELGMRPEQAREWAREQEIGTMIGKRVKFETDQVAKILVLKRGMY